MLQKDTIGQWLLDRVCEKLNLMEKDYFGLRYVDAEKQRVNDTSALLYDCLVFNILILVIFLLSSEKSIWHFIHVSK